MRSWWGEVTTINRELIVFVADPVALTNLIAVTTAARADLEALTTEAASAA